MKKVSLPLWLILPLFFSCYKNYIHTVGYEVHNIAKTNITYVDGNGKSRTLMNADSVWYNSFPSDNDGILLKLNVTSVSNQPVSGKIWIDGVVVAESQPSASVSLSVRLPEKGGLTQLVYPDSLQKRSQSSLFLLSGIQER